MVISIVANLYKRTRANPRLRANLSCENDPFYLHENSLSLALKRKLESNWYLAYLTLVVANRNGFNFQIMDS